MDLISYDIALFWQGIRAFLEWSWQYPNPCRDWRISDLSGHFPFQAP
jgi:hypothetical protein